MTQERIAWLAQRNAWLTRHTGALEQHNADIIHTLAKVAYAATGDTEQAIQLVARCERKPITPDRLRDLLRSP